MLGSTMGPINARAPRTKDIPPAGWDSAVKFFPRLVSNARPNSPTGLSENISWYQKYIMDDPSVKPEVTRRKYFIVLRSYSHYVEGV